MDFGELKKTLSGEWLGTKQLYVEPPVASSSTLSITPIAGGSFLQFNYGWNFEGEAQTGVLLFGSDEKNAASAAWVDSFHMSNKIMFCTGTAEAGSVNVQGSYAAPHGADWSWRIAIRPLSPNELQIVMHNISPAGQEDLAVQADFRRS